MKVIEKGRNQKGWSVEMVCSGSGNGGGGCGAKLLVEQRDLYKTFSHCRDETDEHVTFQCSECSIETDLPRANSPPWTIQESLPSRDSWRRSRAGG